MRKGSGLHFLKQKFGRIVTTCSQVCIYAMILVKKREEAQILSRESGIGFENLRVQELGTTTSHQPTLGSVPESLVGHRKDLGNGQPTSA
ncbi:hypothetical protein D9615_002110 [Tricholomella constricta]|uniref:Uncharacterized protein n=1 Tax=Tricholomella constricta TaxID=117010 RepID=A0A8H5HP13_9AGAR|nr:hypothetical protein D9615_002110 [Tricholomella constricta]